jgi:transmembrane sensor
MNEPYFRRLLEDYIVGQISAADEKEFYSLLEKKEYRAILEQILRQEWNEDKNEEQPNPQLAGLIEQYVMNRINREEPVTRRPVLLFRRYRAASAAAAVLLLAGFAWFYAAHTRSAIHKTTVATQPVEMDLPSGTNGAILTLGNGRQIVLDSAGNGVLSRQGSSTIVKQGDRLAYTSAKGKATGEVLYNTITTPRARQYSNLVLEDGTRVWLDAGSSIRFPVSFTGGERKVEITGQVWFEVVHNEKMPFKVLARGVEISDLGTEFNVNAYIDEEDIRVTLLQGGIRLGQTTLQPGQQARIQAAGGIQILDDVNTADVIAWKNGFFSFRGNDVKGIMRQLSRWYDVDVKYEGISPVATFTGKIDRNLTLAQVLKVLETTRIHFRIQQDRKLIIMP